MEQNLETKSECGDIRKTKANPESTKPLVKKPKDDLPCKNSPGGKDQNASKSACKSNNLIKKTEVPIKAIDSIELDEKIIRRKLSIMSFGDDQKEGFSLKEQSTPSLQENAEKITLKRKNSLDQVHK